MLKNVFAISFLALFIPIAGSADVFEEIKTFSANEARQGVAVDARYIYVIGTREIGKYDKQTGVRVAEWKESDNGPIIHLDSGVVVDGELICAHSNYPGIPMTSSVEIWDTKSLQHIETHSFGIHWGSCTWIDRYQGYWWAVFAHYDKLKAEVHTDNRWSTLVKFDDQWRSIEEWVFPAKLLNKVAPMSISGGSWGPDGLLYCTGHDGAEIFALRLPNAGSVLELVNILPITNIGQGIAWDRNQPGIIYGIIKEKKQVVVSRLVQSKGVQKQ